MFTSYSRVWYGTTRYNMVLYIIVLYGTTWYGMVQHGLVEHGLYGSPYSVLYGETTPTKHLITDLGVGVPNFLIKIYELSLVNSRD